MSHQGAMETNRPLSTAKWVSRRALDSQASHRDSGVGLPHPRGSNADNNPNIANHHQSAERRKYGHAPEAAIAAISRVSGGGGSAVGTASTANSSPVPFHTNGGGVTNRFGISGGGNSGVWSGNAPNSSSTNSKLNHHGNVCGTNTTNIHGQHGSLNNNGNGGGRRGYGGVGGYGEATEPTMPPPPRSVQMGQGTLSAQAAAATSRDFIPQPRHAKVNSSASSHSMKSMEASPPPANQTPGSNAALRWGASATPAQRGANSGATNPRAASPANAPATHFDAHLKLPVPKTGTRSTLSHAADRSGFEAPVSAKASPVFTTVSPPPTKAASTAKACLLSAVPGEGAPAPPVVPPCSITASAVNVDPAPFEAFNVSEKLSFGASVLGGSLQLPSSGIETLLGQVERNTETLSVGAPGERVISGSLRERRSVTDWGIEEAIRTVLPGMDEDDNSDDIQGPNLLSSGLAAITGSWHTSGDVEVQPATSGVAGSLLSDFHTSFAAFSSEPVGLFPQPSFTADASSNTIENLSRAFSTAARVGCSSSTTSPATTAATPLQRPPTSPGVRLPLRTTPVEAVTMPPSTRDSAHPNGSSYTAPTTTPPLPRSTKLESSVRIEDLFQVGGQGGNGELFALYTRSPTITSPWHSPGIGEAATPMAPVNRTSDTIIPRPSGHRSPRTNVTWPEGFQAITLKEGSMSSNGGLTTTTGSAVTPAMAPNRQSNTSSHGGSAPNTPSLGKEQSTPLSGNRSSQPYTPGAPRPQRPPLSAPVVNRQTIAHIFRESPQSLRRKERMEHNHHHTSQALCKDMHWPPHDEADVENMLRDRNATKLLRHLTIISFSRQHVGGVQQLFDTWAKNGIPAPDMAFGAYYYYVKEKSEKLLCMKHNGRGASPGHGYGRCDFETRRPYSTCRYEHVCLFCRSKEHGWFEEGKCQGYQQLLTEMEDLGVTEEDIVTLLNAMERPAKPVRFR
ncbi:hypothetical protein JKF63_05747 [Porcisia hertigi]|uniref:Uncharacterized protein n=1 Tax=Porcisia hertigi TaxID=2761500 RepID=A0A836I954_9TRYP|nr:hypothetical protein JKF63_05747 [Porcisia hertigi]